MISTTTSAFITLRDPSVTSNSWNSSWQSFLGNSSVNDAELINSHQHNLMAPPYNRHAVNQSQNSLGKMDIVMISLGAIIGLILLSLLIYTIFKKKMYSCMTLLDNKRIGFGNSDSSVGNPESPRIEYHHNAHRRSRIPSIFVTSTADGRDANGAPNGILAKMNVIGGRRKKITGAAPPSSSHEWLKRGVRMSDMREHYYEHISLGRELSLEEMPEIDLSRSDSFAVPFFQVRAQRESIPQSPLVI